MIGRNPRTRRLRRLLQALMIVLLLPTLVVSADDGAIQLGKTELVSRGYPDELPLDEPAYGLGKGGNSVYTSLSWFETVSNYPKLAFASAADNLIEGAAYNDQTCQSEVSSEPRGCYDIFVQNPLNLMLQSIANPVFITGLQTDVEGDALFPTLSRDGKYLVFQSGAEYSDFDVSSVLETDIFLAILPQDHNPNDRPPLFRVSAQQGGSDPFPGTDANFHSGNVDCDPVIFGVNHEVEPLCRYHPSGTVKPKFTHPHPVADATFVTGQGVYVVFESMANLGENSNGYIKDIFIRQATDDQENFSHGFTHTLLSQGCSGQPANGDSYHPVFVPGTNGRFVVFVSRATNLDCGIPESSYPADNPSAPLHQRRANIFLHDRQTGQTHLISKVDNMPGNGASEYPAVTLYQDSTDSEPILYIAFQSSASNLVSGDTNGFTDVFLYQASLSNPTSGEIRPISRTTGESGSYGEEANAPSYSPAISGDGKLITFTSYATNLVVGDDNTSCLLLPPGIEGWVSNNCPDIFARRWRVNQTWRVSLTTVGEQARWNSNFSALSLSGRFVAFSSGADMLSQGEGVPYQQVYLRDQGNPPGNPNIQPTAYNFGVVPYGESRTKEFIVDFYAPLTYLGLEISEGSDYFSIESTTCETDDNEYQEDQSCKFTIKFTAPQQSAREFRGRAKYLVNGLDPLTGERKDRFVEIGLVGATPVYDVNIPDDPEAITLPFGATRSEVLKVYNTGNYVDTFDLALSHASGCPFTFAYNPNQLTNIQAEQFGEVTVNITVSQSGCQDENANQVRLVATSRGNPAKRFERVIETSSNSYQPTIESVSPDSLAQLNLDWMAAEAFEFTVRNDGDIADTFTVSYADHEFSLWLDPADAPQLANLPPGQSAAVRVWVRATQPNHSDDIRVIFTSQGDPSKQDERTVRVTSGPAKIFLPLVRK